jgi:DNA excision repair protein ERCC-1
MTLILAFSNLEAARYLETYKSLENTSPDTIKETAGKGDHTDQVRVALSSVKSINSTDVVNLLHTFGSVAKIFTASLEQLATVPGLGEKKIAALFNAFHQPFVTSAALIPSTQMLKTHQPAISSFFKHRGNLSPSQS